MERTQPVTTTSGRSPVTNLAPRRESAANIVIDFDFDNGNFIRDLITTNVGGALPVESAIGPMDASIYIWITHLFQMSWFDALAPYHPTAVGVHSRIPRRPSSESATNRNKNIAGKAIVRARAHDGMNALGDEGRKYNGQPYDDYTGYRPVNTAYELVNPSRWQPAMGPHRRRVGGGLPGTVAARAGDKGIFIVQRFVTPQLGLVKAYTYQDPGQFEIDPPDHIDHTNPSRYKRRGDARLWA